MHKRRVLAAGLVALSIVISGAVAGASASAQPATIFPDPSECDVDPRSVDAVEAIVAVATPTEHLLVDHEDQLPQGRPADAETVTDITAVARTYVACLNAADWPRAFALLSEQAVSDFLDSEQVAGLFATAGTPETDASGQIEVALVEVRDVRVFDDGRVDAIVTWGRRPAPGDEVRDYETNFHTFVQVDGQWLLDEEISGRLEPTSVPGATPQP